MAAYGFEGPRWQSTRITWSLALANYAGSPGSFSQPISDEYTGLVAQAFARWASVSNLTFVPAADAPNVDIRVGFAVLGTPSTNTIGLTTYYGQTVGSARYFLPGVSVELEDPTEKPITVASGV
ncbi:MAG TPA: hypothetical protein VGC80_08100, partial [Acetobacteraceae bacterium]